MQNANNNGRSDQLAMRAPNPIAPTPDEPQRQRVAEEKLSQLTFTQRKLTQRPWAKFLQQQLVEEERFDYEFQRKILATFREAKLAAFREFYGAELIKFGMEVRTGLAEYATAAHQRLEATVIQAEAAYLEIVRKKIALYASYSDLPQHTEMLRERLLPDMERFLTWTALCIDHAKDALQERVKNL